MADQRGGILYLVATPIGNLADLGQRAAEILRTADCIATEDTRHSRPLLDRYGISRPTLALHEHNEDAIAERLVARLQGGETIALISDAGTPLISDPGFPLVRLAREAGVPVRPVPGPCALIAALSASGLPADRFAFEGFLPRKSAARRAFLESLRGEPRTQVFYESSHRIVESVTDFAATFPAERRLVIARELTKVYESIVDTTVGAAPGFLEGNADACRGEFVLILEGAPKVEVSSEALTEEQARVLGILLGECSVKTAVALTVKLTGARRDAVYRRALEMDSKADSGAGE